MDIQLESSGMDVALESGVRHLTMTFLGEGVVFASDGYPVTADRWSVALVLDEQDVLQGVNLEMQGLDVESVKALSQAVALPEAANTGNGAEAVRLQLKPEFVDTVVRPAMHSLTSLPALIELLDAQGQPLFFDLSHFVLQDLTPRAAAA